MNKSTDEGYTQPLGLDVGTSRIVVARYTEKKYTYESQLNAFLALPYSKLAESLLQRENVFHEVRGGDLVVMGDDAQKFAEVFHVETRRPMWLRFSGVWSVSACSGLLLIFSLQVSHRGNKLKAWTSRRLRW